MQQMLGEDADGNIEAEQGIEDYTPKRLAGRRHRKTVKQQKSDDNDVEMQTLDESMHDKTSSDSGA